MITERFYSVCASEALATSELPAAQEYKGQLRAWTDELPAEDRASLDGRLSSANDEDCYSARLELYLHHVFVSKGWTVTAHPQIQGVTRRPDFRVERDDGEFIVEAVGSFGDETARRQDRYIRELADYLRRVKGPFIVHMGVKTRLTGSYSKRRVAMFLQEWVNSLDGHQGAVHPAGVYCDEDASTVIEFTVFGTQPACEEVIGLWTPHAATVVVINNDQYIGGAVRRKSSRYGQLGVPYLIVVSLHAEFPVTLHSIMDTLYGKLRITVDGRTGQTVGARRALNGVFTARRSGNPTSTRVSAVGIYEARFGAGEAIEHRFAVLHNPYAVQPLDANLFSSFPQYVKSAEVENQITMAWQGDPPWSH